MVRFQTACAAWDLGLLSVMEAEAMALNEVIHNAIFNSYLMLFFRVIVNV